MLTKGEMLDLFYQIDDRLRKLGIAMGCEGARATSVDELASRAMRKADERNRKLEHNSTMHNRRAR